MGEGMEMIVTIKVEAQGFCVEMKSYLGRPYDADGMLRVAGELKKRAMELEEKDPVAEAVRLGACAHGMPPCLDCLMKS